MEKRDNNTEKRDNPDNHEFDPTKEAFFSDLKKVEEELTSEAYELVAHALSLMEAKYYNDAIEVLRQAIGLYSQINKEAEIEALQKKITEIYLLKEQNFQEIQLEEKIETKLIQDEQIDKGQYDEIYTKADCLIVEGLRLVNSAQYDEALGEYREAITLLQKISKFTDIEKVNELIEDCYNRIADYIKNREEQRQSSLESSTTELELKAQRVHEFEVQKRKESEFSNHAYELLGKATELVKGNQYDDAIKVYEEGAKLFQEINWLNEVKKIDTLIENVRTSKKRFITEQQKQRSEQENLRKLELQKQESLIQEVKLQEDLKIKAKAEKVRELSVKKGEEEKFRIEIRSMIDNAEKIAREYDLEMKKLIKKGKLVENCIYPEVIKMYEEVKRRVDERGWKDQSELYYRQIQHYQQLLDKDNKLRQIEAEKEKKEKEFEESFKLKKEREYVIREAEIQKQLEAERLNEQENLILKKKIESEINNTEKIAREYEVKFKKAVRDGDLDIISQYPNVIELYTNAKNLAQERGWHEEVAVYTSQIKKYRDLLEKENKVRELEAKKLTEMEQLKDFYKIKPESIGFEKFDKTEAQRIKSWEEESFQKEISNLVDKAEKKAREYEIAKKKAIKEGKFLEKSPYLEIIEIYTNIRNKVAAKGWNEQALVYTNQIKIYQEKLENDIKLRQIEQEKIQKQQEFEELQKKAAKSHAYDQDMEKMIKVPDGSQFEQEEERFEREIDEMIDAVEKEAREYELAIKRGQFEKECPYLKLAETYKIIREKVHVKGWKAESEIYSNQIALYLEKFENDKRLRDSEAQKVKRQEEYEKSLKKAPEFKVGVVEKSQKTDVKLSENEILLNKAMDLINSSENEIRSYELSLKKDLLTYSSPYEKAIKNYEDAKNLFQKIGWKDEARRLLNTITFYKDKKVKDDNLRQIEKQKMEKMEKEKIEVKIEQKQKSLSQEFFIMEYAEKKTQETKKAEQIFELINKAEALVKEYEVNKKEGILNIESPFKQIIDLYNKAQEGFLKIGWLEQANQINGPIKYYQEKFLADQKLRAFEKEKILKEEEAEKKRFLEAKLAKEAEVELLKQKSQAIDLRKKQTMEYEMKKEEAFNIMDLAKKEFKQDHFEKAIRLYLDCEKIFAEMNWQEGTKMIKESITAIKLKKERIEKEKELLERKEIEKLRLEAQIEDKIAKARDFKKDQEEQHKREIFELERVKEREKEISDEAYKLLEEGTTLKNKKKFEDAFEKYILARDLFNKIDWQHEVSRINNDLLFILKKEMKQEEKIKIMLQKKEEEEKELETLLKEADQKRLELEKIRKEEKQKQREQVIQEDLDNANNVIKNLRYNEGIFMIMQMIKRLNKKKQEKLIKQLTSQIQILENASQIPIITLGDLDIDEDMEQFKLAYQALDNAQISLSEKLIMKAISELNEAKFNLMKTKIGQNYIPDIEAKINSFKRDLGIEFKPEEAQIIPEPRKDDLRERIAERRAERKKRVKDILGKE